MASFQGVPGGQSTKLFDDLDEKENFIPLKRPCPPIRSPNSASSSRDMQELQQRVLNIELDTYQKASEFFDRASPVLDQVSELISRASPVLEAFGNWIRSQTPIQEPADDVMMYDPVTGKSYRKI